MPDCSMAALPSSIAGIFHRALGIAALAGGVAYGVAVLWQWSEMRPFTFLGWHREHLVTRGVSRFAAVFDGNGAFRDRR